MTSELEEMGESVGLLGPGAGRERSRGAGSSLEFVSVVSDQGSCPHPVPVHGPDSGLRVCRWEKASESRFTSVLLYLFLCRGLSGSVCPTLRVPVSFLAPICSSTPFSIIHHQLSQPPLTGRKASPSLQTEWTWRVRFPLTGAGRAADCPQPRALREAGVPDRGPLASP